MLDELSWVQIGIAIALLCIGLFVLKEKVFPKQVSFDPIIRDDGFISEPTFTGAKPGYIFKRGDKGQGYYKEGN